MDTKQKRPPAGGAKRTTQARGKTAAKKTDIRRPRRKPTQQKPTPEVVYTQPEPLRYTSFLLKLLTVIAVVIALLFGMSIFFKVKTVTVAGMNKYTAWDVREASGIREGENLLTLSEPQIGSRIRSKLPYVNKVRVGIKLPDTVKIEIEELDVVYAVEAGDASWWLIRSDGLVVDSTNAADAERYTKILGLQLDNPEVGRQAVAMEQIPDPTEETAEVVPVTVTAGERLDAAITIAQYLESNGIIGEAANINTADMGQLEVWYQDRFQILLGDTTQLSYKVQMVSIAISQYMETYDSGILDASMTIQPDPDKEYQVIYSPFE